MLLRPTTFLIALAFATGAIAQNQVETSPATAKPPVEKKICRSETETGSVMSKRICHTKTEWNAIDANNESNISRFRDRPTANNRQLQQ